MRMRVCVHSCSHRGPSREGREGTKCGVSLKTQGPWPVPLAHSPPQDGPLHGWRRQTCPEIPPRDLVSAPQPWFLCVPRGQCPHVCPHSFPVSVLTGTRMIPHCPSYFSDPTGTRRRPSHHEARAQSPSLQTPTQGAVEELRIASPASPGAGRFGETEGSSQSPACLQTPFSQMVVVQRAHPP